ncbi:general stress protein [Phocicoccus pinnipedialis]|uniref:Uncharacterized protein n=1 Tax=Phocicoccus pinnipedialis TaxID=110845 RepID=A0A6V7R4F6_9BACL|nr:general stress protein [Jeotgalicoccus pinnipedialis]MBP1939697.1 hypothetical protein [Jeotgalicoccus pinnipedialis]CAD2072319.1 hypothetical protein JEOPIN946_00417 [Jeotgalicoccus pinnipedialis]
MFEKFEIINDVPALIRRIKELRDVEGIDPIDIHVYAKQSQTSEIHTNYKVNLHRGEGNLFQKFTALFSDESAEDKATERMKLTEEEAQIYHEAVEDGKLVLQVTQDAKLKSLQRRPIEDVGSNSDDSVHIDLSKRDDY